MNGVRRFDDLVARLGISRATLADRLRRLTAAGHPRDGRVRLRSGPDAHRVPDERTRVGPASRADRAARVGRSPRAGCGQRAAATGRPHDGAPTCAPTRRRRDRRTGRGTRSGARARTGVRRDHERRRRHDDQDRAVDRPGDAALLELAREAERAGSTRCGWPSTGPTTRSRRSPRSPRSPTGCGWPPASPSSGRTPAMLAMTAQGVQAVSDGRLILGIGASGPQVMEGWHGVPFDRPVHAPGRRSRSSR